MSRRGNSHGLRSRRGITSAQALAALDGGASRTRFHRLLERAVRLKKALQGWAHALPGLHRSIGEYRQLVPQHASALAEMVRLLDRMYGHHRLTKRERHLMSEMISDLAADLVAKSGDDELKAIYNRHSRSNFDAEVAALESERTQSMREFLESALGIELGDDVASVEETRRAEMARIDEEALAKREPSPHQLAAWRAGETAQPRKILPAVVHLLAEQLRTLRDELTAVEAPWRAGMGDPYGKLTPVKVAARLREDLESLQGAMVAIRADLGRLSDVDELRAWLHVVMRPASRNSLASVRRSRTLTDDG